MYPVIRMFWQLFRHRRSAPLSIGDQHVSHHYCMPWDIDLWMELNNGRTLTLFDLGRVPMFRRLGVVHLLRERGWGAVIAGASVRYRRRVLAFERIEMRSRLVCWDDRFFYMEQSMWKKNGDCANHVLLRSAITGPEGIVPPGEAMKALGPDAPDAPPIPDWVTAWIAADQTRPWPPMQG